MVAGLRQPGDETVGRQGKLSCRGARSGRASVPVLKYGEDRMNTRHRLP